MQTADPDAARRRAAQLSNYFVGFWGTWVVHLGRELGLFRALEEEPLAAAGLAERLAFEADYVEVWCRAAHSFDLLERGEDGRYRLGEGVAEALEISGPQAGALVQVSHRVCETLEAVFRGTAPPEPRFSLHLQVAQLVRASYRDLWQHQLPRVPEIAGLLAAGGRLVEFGCGCGYGLEMIRRLHPQIEPTGLEVDFDCAREAERVTRAVIVVGTPEDCRYESRFDLALFHRSLSEAEDPTAALERAVAALKPGGYLVVTLPDDLPVTEEEVRSDRGRLRLGERLFYGMFLAPEPRYNPTREQLQEMVRSLPLEEVAVLEPDQVASFILVFRRTA